MVGPDSATVNGLYLPTDEIHNNEALYVKEEDPGICIRYAKDKRWTVSDLYHKDANINGGFLKCAEKHLPDPTLAKVWKVDGKAQASVVVIHETSKQVRLFCLIYYLGVDATNRLVMRIFR